MAVAHRCLLKRGSRQPALRGGLTGGLAAHLVDKEAAAEEKEEEEEEKKMMRSRGIAKRSTSCGARGSQPAP